MEKLDWSFRTTDGLDLFAHVCFSIDNPKAVIVLIHGIGEHTGRYDHVGLVLAEKGYVLAGFDMRGHGKSGGPKGHTPSYDSLLDDINVFLMQVEKRFPGQRYFLFGHSMGGNLVLNYALRCKSNLQGVIATSPWLKLAFEPPTSKVMLARLMNTLAPGFTQTSGLDTKALSRDATVVTAYENDPLVHNKISARLFISMYESGLWALDHAAEFPLPLLLMQGSADRLDSLDATKEFATKAGAKVTLRVWDGFFHELHNEPGKAEVFKMIVEWLEKNQ
jgi:alpha-beta hydrolase superfamily lysophospholipase